MLRTMLTRYISGILGGMTGDTLGAGDELSEILFLGQCAGGLLWAHRLPADRQRTPAGRKGRHHYAGITGGGSGQGTAAPY